MRKVACHFLHWPKFEILYGHAKKYNIKTHWSTSHFPRLPSSPSKMLRGFELLGSNITDLAFRIHIFASWFFLIGVLRRLEFLEVQFSQVEFGTPTVVCEGLVPFRAAMAIMAHPPCHFVNLTGFAICCWGYSREDSQPEL